MISADAKKERVRSALDEIESETCVVFKEQEEEPYVEVFSDVGGGCYSHVGMRDGSQKLSLGSAGCFGKGVIIHEFLHALGFFHMQSSHDRDNFVRIKPENVAEKYLHNFNKYSNAITSHFGTEYDLDSVMHYRARQFSKNGKITIETLDEHDSDRIGQRRGLSSGDAERINKMYECD